MTTEEPLPDILEYEYQKSLPQEVEALRRLRRVASRVKPIVRKRNWKDGILAKLHLELNVLDQNCRREKIYLPLRCLEDEAQYLQIEIVVNIMLHEITHMVY